MALVKRLETFSIFLISILKYARAAIVIICVLVRIVAADRETGNHDHVFACKLAGRRASA